MSTSPPDGPDERSIAENAARIASESLTHYDEASDTYHCSYGPPVPAVTVHDAENQVLVRVEPSSGTVVGFSIPQFRAWHAEHADEDGTFEVSLPSVWPLGTDQEPPTDA
ncbi:MAG: hypothetical protein KDB60_17525 [Propionibacteriaceae bacterium]|nr:hypothetical protein [Propionibacteriaceae bacterium]